MAMVDPISQTRSDKQYFGAERVKQGRHESKRGIGEYIYISSYELFCKFFNC